MDLVRLVRVAAATIPMLSACGVPGYGGFSADAGVDSSAGSAGAGSGGTSGTGGSAGTGASGGAAGIDAGDAGGAAGSDAASGCGSDLDCTGAKKHCNTASGLCVTCLPQNDDCPGGSYCASTFTCRAGCKTDAECNAGLDGGVLTCDPTLHRCLGCAADVDCPLGKVCNVTSTECIPGCTAQHGCPAGNTPDCCAGQCTNVLFDDANCSACGTACDQQLPNVAVDHCQVGKCLLTCTAFHADCNKDPADGCEVDVRTDDANCGGCGSKCAAGTTCTNSACQ